MFKRIVVPLDGTEFAEASLAPAQDLARRFCASILLVRGVRPANLPRLYSPITGDSSRGGLEVIDESDAYLDGMTTQLRAARFDVSYALFIAEPGAAIATVAELDHADLICMATHQRWTLNLTRSDSTTLQVLARSHVPILAWRGFGPPLVGSVETEAVARTPAVPSPVAPVSPESPIVVPLDGSALAESALPIAEHLAKALDAELVLVRAAPGDRDDLSRVTAYLDGMCSSIASRGVGVVAAARAGSAPVVIDAVRRERNAGLIVMASHGSRGELLGFLGSVAGAIVEETDAPVLVVRPAPLGAHAASGSR